MKIWRCVHCGAKELLTANNNGCVGGRPHLWELIETAAGVKYDQQKPRPDLIPPNAENEIAKVLAYGAAKYSPENWRLLDDAENRYVAASLRHINAHRRGEKLDPESGLRHLACAVTSLMFIMELDHENSVSAAAKTNPTQR